MSTHTGRWPAGTPCWTDLSTPDVTAAVAFYRGVVPAWTYSPPNEASGGYVLAQVDGRSAAGLGPQFGGAPVGWTLYLAVDDADATQEAVVRLGGSVLLPAGDVGDFGRMAVIADPAGAAVGLWQAGTHEGIGFTGEPGCLAWEDLRSTDPEASRAFYAELFGFQYSPVPGAGDDYRVFALPDAPEHPLGGMGGLMGEQDVPSHWLVYFGVADVAASVASATAGGGTVQVPPRESPYGVMAGLVDPAGAGFWLHQPSPDAAS